MDLTDQRLACLRMAMELNCQTEPLLKAANELMNFVASGTLPASASETAKPDVAIDTIAACGTALQMPDVGGLEAAQPVNQSEPAEPAAVADTADTENEAADTEPDGATETDTSALPSENPAAVEAPPEAVEPDSSEPVAESAEVEGTATVGEADVEAAVGTATDVASEATAEVHVADANPEQAAAVH